MLEKSAQIGGGRSLCRALPVVGIVTRNRPTGTRLGLKWKRGSGAGLIAAASWAVTTVVFPTVGMATHEADHRFTVEGYVCGPDGKGVANTDVLVKDTKVSYGQVVKTDGDGYYQAKFHLHNENLGDPLLVEAKGEQQHRKVQFNPKDLESERKIQVDFGSGCDVSGPPVWLWWGSGMAAAAAAGIVGLKVVRSQRKRDHTRGKLQGKRKH